MSGALGSHFATISIHAASARQCLCSSSDCDLWSIKKAISPMIGLHCLCRPLHAQRTADRSDLLFDHVSTGLARLISPRRFDDYNLHSFHRRSPPQSLVDRLPCAVIVRNRFASLYWRHILQLRLANVAQFRVFLRKRGEHKPLCELMRSARGLCRMDGWT